MNQLRSRSRNRVGCFSVLAALLAFVVPGTAQAGELPATIPPGFDLFETDPQDTFLNFGNGTTIPANFFGQGSDPFVGRVNFGGGPLETFMGRKIGDADTIVQRMEAIAFPGGSLPRSDTVPIEIVALNLVSMQPITVRYNGGHDPERWQVKVNLTQTQQQGQANVTEEQTQSGTFDSQLPVTPKFTFTRLSDRKTKPLPFKGPLGFQGQDTPWHLGCIPPVLAVQALTGPFCAGQTPGTPPTGGQKYLTVLQSPPVAHHGVRPVQPMLEHFKCYKVGPRRFGPATAELTDQFGGPRAANVGRRGELCNPVMKNDEPFQNRLTHQVCYGTSGPPVNALVAVQNQLGMQRLRVLSPRRLCAPSQKRLLDEEFQKGFTLIDHYQCYGVEPDSRIQTARRIKKVDLKDQFHNEQDVRIGQPYQLCAPVQKVHNAALFPIQHPVRHLVCYELDQPKLKRKVQIKNQFETKAVKTRRPVGLCIPSNKYVFEN